MTESTEYTPEQWAEMLVAGAQWEGRHNLRAAVHLLVFTEVYRHRLFRGWAEVFTPAGSDRPLAAVTNWSSLAESPIATRAGSAVCRLLAIAASMASGAGVDLRDNLSGFGWAHSRRVVEAVLIATGGDEFYTLQGTDALDRVHQFHDDMAGSGS